MIQAFCYSERENKTPLQIKYLPFAYSLLFLVHMTLQATVGRAWRPFCPLLSLPQFGELEDCMKSQVSPAFLDLRVPRGTHKKPQSVSYFPCKLNNPQTLNFGNRAFLSKMQTEELISWFQAMNSVFNHKLAKRPNFFEAVWGLIRKSCSFLASWLCSPRV